MHSALPTFYHDSRGAMDIPGTGIHIPLWLVYMATFVGIVMNAYVANRNSTKTKQLGVTVNDQFSQVATMVSQFQTSSQSLMQMVLDAKNADIKELQVHVKTLEKSVEDFKGLTETQAADLFKQSSKIVSLETLLGDTRRDTATQIKRLSDQLAESKALITDKDKELDTRAQEILELTRKLQDYQVLEQRVTTLQADVDKLKKDIDAMNAEKAELQKQVADLTAERDAAIKRAEQAERERDEAQALLAAEKKRGTGGLPPLPAGAETVSLPTISNVLKKKQTDQLTDPPPQTIVPVVPINIDKPLVTPPTVHDTQPLKIIPTEGRHDAQ